jgi:hypothetical protein
MKRPVACEWPFGLHWRTLLRTPSTFLGGLEDWRSYAGCHGGAEQIKPGSAPESSCRHYRPSRSLLRAQQISCNLARVAEIDRMGPSAQCCPEIHDLQLYGPTPMALYSYTASGTVLVRLLSSLSEAVALRMQSPTRMPSPMARWT